MDEQNMKPMPLEHAMRSGLEMGLLFVVSFVLDAQSRHYGWLSALSLVVTCLIVYCTYIAAQHYKETECGGKLSYGGAYSYITWLYLCGALVAALLRFVYMQWIDPGLLPHLYTQTADILRQAMPEIGEEQLEQFKALFVPIRFAVYYILYDLVVGCIVALLMAAIVSRRKIRMVFPK